MTETWNGSSWTSAANISGNRYGAQGNIGANNTSAISCGGNNGSNNTFEWNGSGWTALSNMNVAREHGSGQGIATAGLTFAGAPNVVNTELWNGSSWTELADLSTARYNISGSTFNSSNTAALVFGGLGPPTSSATEEWNVPATVTNKTITVS